jgi:hypothetical protein
MCKGASQQLSVYRIIALIIISGRYDEAASGAKCDKKERGLQHH